MSGKQISLVGNGLRLVISILALGVSVSADAGLFGSGGTSWKEEALLHDGSKIIVERSVDRGGRHEIGQSPPIKEQSVSFTLPGTSENVVWHDQFSKDVGGASFLPMMIEIRNGTAFLVVHPMGCLAYNKWGRPNPPYVVFKYSGGSWGRVPLRGLPGDFKTPNLIFSEPDDEARKAGGAVVTAEMIRKLYDGYKYAVFKTILREAYAGASGNCGEMAGNGKGHWLGLDWFKEQPSLDACLKFCVRKDFDAQHCPCNDLFRGE